ncbi:MAG: BadF/BadG/BcrA/BcrD ATPase family protein, partial [Nocardioidaceae bacterium]
MTSLVIGVDVGKTGSRVAICRAGAVATVTTGRGVVPTPGPDGVRRAASALEREVGNALANAGHEQVVPAAVAVGMAGVTTLPGGADALADALARRWPGTSVAVTTDSVTAHAGAVGGGPGVVLAVGTGSVALGLASDGTLHRVDGWGQWLGDDGSGAWIGREALRAVVRASDGRGAPTTMAQAAERRFADAAGLPAVLPFETGLPTRTASFVPDVVAAADGGDDAARDILSRAAQAWA